MWREVTGSSKGFVSREWVEAKGSCVWSAVEESEDGSYMDAASTDPWWVRRTVFGDSAYAKYRSTAIDGTATGLGLKWSG